MGQALQHSLLPRRKGCCMQPIHASHLLVFEPRVALLYASNGQPWQASMRHIALCQGSRENGRFRGRGVRRFAAAPRASEHHCAATSDSIAAIRLAAPALAKLCRHERQHVSPLQSSQARCPPHPRTGRSPCGVGAGQEQRGQSARWCPAAGTSRSSHRAACHHPGWRDTGWPRP